ncbi:hypothetical protein IEO70_10760 [Bacillus sp. AGMB 02131]|uniref:Uncharacterized protein n=1 Tax=Peribacillus faecalis TaxID=2772559 RepID=A0A927HAM4_9BACI|nr:hypothetical protein [Peribacillus faecalis]MBD3108845.1 hypothetical protein [Peribacillus faecalis]
MQSNYIAIGEDVGAISLQGKQVYRVKTNKLIELSEFAYETWETIKTNSNSFNEILQQSLLDNQGELQITVNNLLKQGVIIDLNNSFDELLSKYSIVPKGMAGKETEDGYLLIALRNHDPIDVTIIPFLIWQLAHPFVPIVDVLNAVKTKVNIDQVELYTELIEWIPLLIVSEVISLKPLI